MKIRISPKHLHMTSFIITAVSLALSLSANQPVRAGSPLAVGSEAKSNAIVAKKSKPINLSAVSPPEAGVQLLMGILQRIGNEPQIAVKERAEDAPQFLAHQSQVDPAYVIRPQALKKQSGAQASQAAAPSDQLLAMLPKQKMEASFDKADMGRSISSRGDNQYIDRAGNASSGYYRSGAPASSVGGTHGAVQERKRAPGSGFKDLEKSINRLYAANKFVEEITAGKKPGGDAGLGDESALAGAFADTESKVIKTGEVTRGKSISNYPRITEYGGTTSGIAGLPTSAFGGRAPGPAAEMSDMRQSAAEADRDATHAKPEFQPSIYKGFKEYNAPTTPEPLERAKSVQTRRSASPPLATIAYMPPHLVGGIPGLRLGANEADVDAYLKDKGQITRQKFNSWKVWSLTSSTGKTVLQVYLRNGIVEAFRVFDQSYVPDGLGVALSHKLPSMKKKFGEPQFILDEPSPKNANRPTAKNYVYPVNQVSFQLARTNPNEPPTVQSLLLFQFL